MIFWAVMAAICAFSAYNEGRSYMSQSFDAERDRADELESKVRALEERGPKRRRR